MHTCASKAVPSGCVSFLLVCQQKVLNNQIVTSGVYRYNTQPTKSRRDVSVPDMSSHWLFRYLIIISVSCQAPPLSKLHTAISTKFSLRFATNINHKCIKHRMEWNSVLYITGSCSGGKTAFYAVSIQTCHSQSHFLPYMTSSECDATTHDIIITPTEARGIWPVLPCIGLQS